MTYLLHGGKKHEISQVFAKAETLWVRFEKAQDVEWAMEGMLLNWKGMGPWLHLPDIHQDLPLLGPLSFPGGGAALASMEILLWAVHNEKGSSPPMTRRASTKQAFCFLPHSLLTTTSYDCFN